MTEDLLSRSRYALLTGDLAQAEELCVKAIYGDPDNTQGQLLLGSIFIREGKLQSAQKTFETLLSKEPDNPDALIDSAIVYQKRGKLKAALYSAQKAYRLAGERADIIFNIGNIHRQLGELNKAEQIYRLAIQKNPDFAAAYNNLALLLADSGRSEEAEEALKQGLLIDENNPGLHFNLAEIYSRKGNNSEAAEEYRTALRINPGWEECLLKLGDLLKKDNPAEASRLYKKVLDLSPESLEAVCRTGEIEFERGNIEEAEVIFTRLLADNPLYTAAAVNLAAVYYSGKNLPAAEKLLREHQQNDPENLELRLLLGNILLETGKYNEAFTNIRYVLDRNQNEERAWFAMARQFSLSGKKDRALNTYRKGLNIAPDAYEARMQLALLLKSLGKIDGAVSECEYIYVHSPEEFAPALFLAELYIEKKNFRKAAEILGKLSSAAPEDLKLLQMFAETAREAGLTDKALRAAEQLAAAGHDEETELDLDELNENLQFYDEMASQYAKEYGSSWNKNLKALARSFEAPVKHEEANFLFDGIQDIANEFVPILDVGGIDPVIAFDEEEEFLTITDEDEYIPPPEEEEPPVEEIGKTRETSIKDSDSSAPSPEQEMPADAPGDTGPPPTVPVPSINFGSPLTIKLETAPIVVQQAPAPVPEPEEEPPVEEEEEYILPEDDTENEAEEDAQEDNLFGYLDKLTRFLPQDKRSEYQLSDTKLKLAALKAKMSGDPGLLSRIQLSRNAEGLQETAEEKVKLTKSSIGNTLYFMTGLTEALPDPKLAETLSGRLKGILNRLDNRKGEQVDDITD